MKLPESEHLVLQTGLSCHCKQPAHLYRRCPKCKSIVAVCGAHEHNFAQQVAEHCK